MFNGLVRNTVYMTVESVGNCQSKPRRQRVNISVVKKRRENNPTTDKKKNKKVTSKHKKEPKKKLPTKKYKPDIFA